MATKKTSPAAARSAGKVLASASTGKNSKTAAASALTQKDRGAEKTSARVATAASQVLRDGRTAKDSKSAAGSALSQKTKKTP